MNRKLRPPKARGRPNSDHTTNAIDKGGSASERSAHSKHPAYSAYACAATSG